MKLSPEPNYNAFQLPNFNNLCKVNEKASRYPFIYKKWLMAFGFICKLTLYCACVCVRVRVCTYIYVCVYVFYVTLDYVFYVTLH